MAVPDSRRSAIHGWRRALTAVGLAAAWLIPTAPVAHAQQLESLEKSILLVGVTWTGFVEFPTDTGGWAWSEEMTVPTTCTGWFASEEGHIVTAGHCVDPAEGRRNLLGQFLEQEGAVDLLPTALANWRVEGLEAGSDPSREVQVIQPAGVDGAVVSDVMTVQVVDFRAFKDGDVALLKIASPPEPTPPLTVADGVPEIGEPLTAIGFPGSVVDVVDGSRLRASFKSGTASSQQVSPSGVAGTEINADLSRGMSGGPTVDERGEVLGVNSFTVGGDETRNFNFITNADDLRTFLENNDVPLAAPGDARNGGATSNDAGEGSGSGFPVVPVVVGVGALLLLGGAAAAVAARRRKTPTAAPETASVGARPPGGGAAPSGGGAASGVLVCGRCRHPNGPDAHFCDNCGAALPSEVRCPKCGHVNDARAHFCDNCGNALDPGGSA